MRYFTLPLVTLALAAIPCRAEVVPKGELPNFHQVNERVYRGGQPTDAGIRRLAKLGVKTVIDLRRPDEHPTRAEEQVVEAAGMRYMNVPMSGVAAPPQSDVLKVLEMLNGNAEGPVFVHCRRGADRTGTVIACYRIAHDRWQNDKALNEARSLGMNWVELGMKHYIMNFNPAGQSLAQGSGARSGHDAQ